MNNVEKSNFTENEIWLNINQTRFEGKKKKPDASQLQYASFNLEKFLNFPAMTIISDKVNKEVFEASEKTQIEMFLALTEPPSYFEKLYGRTIFGPGPQSRMIMLALNIVNKSPDKYNVKAKQIFSKIRSTIFKKYQNESFQNRKEISIEKGKIYTYNTNYISIFLIVDKKIMQTESNHPVHILNPEGEFSHSSFIPFCSFGEDFKGYKVNQFEIPVCDIFKPKIHHDQFCYETDLQKLKGNNNQILENQLKKGLTLVLDHNEERQMNYNAFGKNTVSIYLDTISI